MKNVLAILISLSCLSGNIEAQKKNNRVLVTSGGGSRGAWGAGYVNKLSDSLGLYKTAFGTSTGALMNPLILLGKFTELKEGYTAVKQKDIFTVNPFKKNGDLNFWVVAERAIRGYNSLGNSHKLRKRIDDFVSDSDYQAIRSDPEKKFFVSVVDLKTGEMSLKSSEDIASAFQMKNWIWASANQPVFMTLYPSKTYPDPAGGYWVDGGVRETVPLMAAVDYVKDRPHNDTIDVIINQARDVILPAEKPIKNAFGVLKRTIDLWKGEVVINDVLLALSRPEGKCGPDSIVINLHYLPKRFFIKHFNDLVFNPEDMLEMWDAGYRREEDPAGGKFIYQHSEIKICKEKLREYFTELTKYIEEKKKWLQSVK